MEKDLILTIGQVLKYLNDEAETRQGGDYAEAAYTAIEEVVGAIVALDGDFEDHLVDNEA